MVRIIAWLILIFVVLLALRMIALRKARSRPGSGQGENSKPESEPMVRCARCGIFVPRAEAKQKGGFYVCASGACLPHG